MVGVQTPLMPTVTANRVCSGSGVGGRGGWGSRPGAWPSREPQEVATCSQRLRAQGLLHHLPLQVTNRGEAHLELNAFRRKHDCALVISGDSLEVGAGTPGSWHGAEGDRGRPSPSPPLPPGVPQVLRVRIHGAGLPVPGRGLLPLRTHPEGADRASAPGAHREADLRSR